MPVVRYQGQGMFKASCVVSTNFKSFKQNCQIPVILLMEVSKIITEFIFTEPALSSENL